MKKSISYLSRRFFPLEVFSKGLDEQARYSAIWFSRDGELLTYFYGYRNASKILIKWFVDSRGDNGTVYPLIFLIRHTIELGLKEIIRLSSVIKLKPNLPKEKMNKFWSEVWEVHNLKVLSSKCNELLKEFNLEKYTQWEEALEFLEKWQMVDEGNTFGRYPVLNDGSAYDVKDNVYAGKIVEVGILAFEAIENILSMMNDLKDEYDKMLGDLLL